MTPLLGPNPDALYLNPRTTELEFDIDVQLSLYSPHDAVLHKLL